MKGSTNLRIAVIQYLLAESIGALKYTNCISAVK